MKIYEKYAWIVLLSVGLLWLVVGIVAVYSPEGIFEGDAQAVTNLPWTDLKASSPEASNFIIFVYGQMGLLKISWSLFILAITLTGFRRGEKWAWYIMLLAPILLVSDAVFSVVFIGDINQVLQFIPITAITMVGLLLPYRIFFPKKRSDVQQ
jgi:magnesium-transporting ATPase (P-type)